MVCSKRELSRNRGKMVGLVFLCFLSLLVKLLWRRGSLAEDPKQYADLSVPRYVYFWNRPGWVDNTLFKNCDAKCLLVNDYLGYNQSHAVIFDLPSLDVNFLPVKFPGHLWVAYVMESPDRMRSSFKNWRYVFNWTMSYRRDSDILSLVGEFYMKKRQYENVRVSSMWDQKVRPISWLESICHTQSRREDYVRELQKHVTVHTYGRCGKYTCPRSTTLEFPDTRDNNCQLAIDHGYKFHLAFESCLCKDYITEKVFNMYRLNSVIPVVRGGANYQLYLPPGSYITVSNFPSPYSLSKHLRQSLKKNASSLQPFLFKDSYSIRSDVRHSFCDLCKRLHAPNLSERFYADFDSWLRVHNGWPLCVEPRDI